MTPEEIFALAVKLANELRAEGLPVMGVGHGGDHVEIGFRPPGGGVFWIESPPEAAAPSVFRRRWASRLAEVTRPIERPRPVYQELRGP